MGSRSPILLIWILSCTTATPAAGKSDLRTDEGSARTEILSASGPLSVGQEAPRFGGWDANNTVVRLDHLLRPPRGKPARGVVVSFFATWCLPCRRGLPALSSIAAELRGQGVPIVLVAVGERADKFSPFLRDLGVDLPAVEDRFGKIAQRYGVVGADGEGKLPRTFVLNAAGRITAIFGREGADFAELVRARFDRPATPPP